MGQDSSITLANNNQLTRTLSRKGFRAPADPIDHEGVLKLRDVPFRNCMRISQQPPLFLENADYTLREILQERYGTTRLLTEEDLLNLQQSLLYAMAYLQSKAVVYKDLVPQNIYYQADQRAFKLLPPQLIDKSSFKMIREGTRFSMASPEMIVALRCQSLWISNEMYHRSNIFTLGMIMLEVATLRPSSDCYESGTLDILDKVVKERLAMVGELYPPIFRNILEKMLCYDYQQRMNPQQLSVYVFEVLKAPILHLKQFAPQQHLPKPEQENIVEVTAVPPVSGIVRNSRKANNLNMSQIEDYRPPSMVSSQTTKARYFENPLTTSRGVVIQQPDSSPERTSRVQHQQHQAPYSSPRVMSRSIVVESQPVHNPEQEAYYHTPPKSALYHSSQSPTKQVVIHRLSPRRHPKVNNALEVIEEKAEPEGTTAQAHDSLQMSDIPTTRSNREESSFTLPESRNPAAVNMKTVRLVKQMIDPYSKPHLPVRFTGRSPESLRRSHAPADHSSEREEQPDPRSNAIDIDDIDEEIARVKKQLEQSKKLLQGFQARNSAVRSSRH